MSKATKEETEEEKRIKQIPAEVAAKMKAHQEQVAETLMRQIEEKKPKKEQEREGQK